MTINLRSFSRRALALLALAAAPCRTLAAPYGVATEWPSVSFRDGAKTLTLFIHMSDIDTPSFEKSDPGASGVALYVPLYALTLKDVTHRGRRPYGDVESMAMTSRSTPYRLLVGVSGARPADPDKKAPALTHRVERAPDFKAVVNSEPVSLLQTFGLTAPSPDNVLVRVSPEAEAPAPNALNDIETAAISSLDGAERAEWTSDCAGEPGTPAAMDCWHAKVKDYLDRHKTASAGPDDSRFEERYLKLRLSPKGYERIKQALELPADSPEKLALLKNWRETIVSRDITENAEEAAKAAAKTAAAVSSAPGTPNAPSGSDVSAAPGAPAEPGKPNARVASNAPAKTPKPKDASGPGASKTSSATTGSRSSSKSETAAGRAPAQAEEPTTAQAAQAARSSSLLARAVARIERALGIAAGGPGVVSENDAAGPNGTNPSSESRASAGQASTQAEGPASSAGTPGRARGPALWLLGLAALAGAGLFLARRS